MFRVLLRPAMIFIPFLMGICFPQAHVLNEAPFHLVKWGLCIMVFLACLQLDFHQLKLRREHWIIAAINVMMGIFPYFFLKIFFPEQPVLAAAAFFVGITPTATAAPVVVSFLNGRIGFALTGFVLSTVVISSSLLILLPFLTGNITIHFVLNIAENKTTY